MVIEKDWRTFIKANTRLISPPLIPEIKLHLAEESLPIWRRTEEELQEINVPPPYWAFAWAGGQALARYLLDHRHLVARRSVVDLGAGSGMTAVAACLAGASEVLACDIDTVALAAIGLLNAVENGVDLTTTGEDLLGVPRASSAVVLVGDLFYERELAERVLEYIRVAQLAGAKILIGDPQRSYFPKTHFRKIEEYRVPVTRELEDAEVKQTAVWEPIGPEAR